VSPTPLRRLGFRPTTLRSRWVFLLFLGAPSAAAEGPKTEADAVRLYLQSELGTLEREASHRTALAARTAPAHANPELEVRHEEARGPAGATTDAVGGAISLDLGLSGLAERSAAKLRGEAGSHWQASTVLDGICAIRRDSTDLFASASTAAAIDESQTRLEALMQTLDALAAVGEVSGYDRDRARLTVTAHRLQAATAGGDLATLRARLSAIIGTSVTDLVLEPLPPLPARDSWAGQAHPEIEALRYESLGGAKAESAAKRAAIPDLRVSGGARWDAPPGGTATPGFEVGGALQLPLLDGSRDQVRKAAAERAQTDFRLSRRRAELSATAESAWLRADALSSMGEVADPAGIWDSAVARYSAGEGSLEDLLQVAEGVEAASVASIEHQRQLRHARIDLACAIGRFDEPALQDAFEEATR